MLLFSYLFHLSVAFLQMTTQTWSPAEIRWQQVNPDGSKYAVLEGDRHKAGELFTYAFFLPDGVWVGPHMHSQDARVAVVSGTLLLGEGPRMSGEPQPLPTGTFFVVLSEQHQTCPDNLDIEIGVQPASGRLPEARYHFWRDNKVRGQVQYKSEVHFDAQEIWNVLLILKSVRGGGEATSSVMVTPPGFGRWDLLFYASPFALVAILWFRAVSRQKRKKRSQ